MFTLFYSTHSRRLVKRDQWCVELIVTWVNITGSLDSDTTGTMILSARATAISPMKNYELEAVST